MYRIVMAVVLLVLPAVQASEALEGGQLLDLARRSAVQKELKLTAAQQADIVALVNKANTANLQADEANTALEKVLQAQQLNRLRQIRYQLLGGAACIDPAVQKALGLSAEVIRRIQTQWESDELSLQMVLKVARFRSAEARHQFILKTRQDNGKKLLDLLTQEQRDQYNKLQGRAFDLKALDN
jgi:transposase